MWILPRISTIERFAAALGVSPGWLAYGEGPEPAVQAESTAGGIGLRLETTRKARGLSRQALGNAAGLTGQTVANIEVHGMIPRVDTVELLARALVHCRPSPDPLNTWTDSVEKSAKLAN